MVLEPSDDVPSTEKKKREKYVKDQTVHAHFSPFLRSRAYDYMKTVPLLFKLGIFPTE